MAKSAIINVAILGDAKKLNKALAGAEKRVGKFSGKVGKSMKAVSAGFAGLGVAGVGAVLKFGQEFEKVERTLRVGTGATGDALQGLIDITQNLATRVPAGFEEISTAVADVNTRLGLTGSDLEAFSEQMLNLSRITGSDLQGNISGVTRVLGDWGDMAGTAGDAADFLFTVAQSTGIAFGTLSDQLVQYGAPMRQLGFSFDEAAALLGKFEKEGVNAELVMGSMRQALGKMAREGEPAIETFQRVTEQIKLAGSASEANAIALDLFGARAGPDMAAAVREGRFQLDDFFETMAGGGDKINAAAAETQTLSEKFTLLKNRVAVAAAPAIGRAFDGLVDAFDSIGPAYERVSEWFRDVTNSERFQAFQRTTARIFDAIEESARVLARFFQRFVQPIIVAATLGVVSVFRKLWDVVSEVAGLIEALFRGDMEDVWKHFKNLAVAAVDLVVDVFIRLPYRIGKAARGLVSELGGMVWKFQTYLVDKVVGIVQAMPGKIIELLAAVGSDIIEAGKQLGGWILDGILDALKGLGSKILDLLPGGGLFGKLFQSTSAVKQRLPKPTLASAAGFPRAEGGLMRGAQFETGPGGMSRLVSAGTSAALAGREGELFHATVDLGALASSQGNITVNVAGSVTTETELVETIRTGLIKSQQSGRQLVI